MIQVNLLPWREEARRRKKVRFITFISIACATSFMVLILLHMRLYFISSGQYEINSALQEAINEAQVSLNQMSALEQEKDNVIRQMRILADFRAESFGGVRVLKELAVIIPSMVSLTRIKRNGEEVTLEGVTVSDGEITNLMSSIVKSSYFETPEITSINQDKSDSKLKSFKIRMKLKGESS